MKRLALIVCIAAVAYGQSATAVNQVGGPAPAPFVTLLDYSGTTLTYTGVASEYIQQSNTWLKRSNSTLTNIAVATNVATATCATACGVWKGQRVTVSGATVDTDLNATYTVTSNTSTSATTFTFTTASVADATYTESTLQIATNNPLTTQPLWAITVLKYDGSSNLISTYWANASTGLALQWANRATY